MCAALFNYILCYHTDGTQFSLKFTKGDAIIEPAKLFFLQKKHAQRYIESGGEEFGSMVLRVAAVAEEYSKLNQVYEKSRCEAIIKS